VYNLDELNKEFKRNRPKLVVVNHGSNVCGLVAPLTEIAALARDYGAWVLVDAAQTLGTIPIDMLKQNVDFLVFAGPQRFTWAYWGLAVWSLTNSTNIEPFIFGGTGVGVKIREYGLLNTRIALRRGA